MLYCGPRDAGGSTDISLRAERCGRVPLPFLFALLPDIDSRKRFHRLDGRHALLQDQEQELLPEACWRESE